ncbi:Hypothetical predicted protein [Podarcis lilfordi]|uniref:Uncharacterized protein n=1 Tax=Podarcis lilfordi TaxID=74358 RepID=A0AA35K2W5_9SAUR|nr:Hypothetical predicted protein [Podarcis lilfordi]
MEMQKHYKYCYCLLILSFEKLVDDVQPQTSHYSGPELFSYYSNCLDQWLFMCQFSLCVQSPLSGQNLKIPAAQTPQRQQVLPCPVLLSQAQSCATETSKEAIFEERKS